MGFSILKIILKLTLIILVCFSTITSTFYTISFWIIFKPAHFECYCKISFISIFRTREIKMGNWNIYVMIQKQTSMMLMMHIVFMKLPNLVCKREVWIYKIGSQTTRTCTIALMNMRSITYQQTIITKC